MTAQGLVDPDLYRRTLPAILAEERFGSVLLAIILTDPQTTQLKLPPILDGRSNRNCRSPLSLPHSMRAHRSTSQLYTNFVTWAWRVFRRPNARSAPLAMSRSWAVCLTVRQQGGRKRQGQFNHSPFRK